MAARLWKWWHCGHLRAAAGISEQHIGQFLCAMVAVCREGGCGGSINGGLDCKMRSDGDGVS
jgi:hypothetical protein